MPRASKRSALVAEKKKGKYVYYHCTGNKGKCPEPYTREEVLDECFADLLKGLIFDDQVMDWIIEALHQSHAHLRRFSYRLIYLQLRTRFAQEKRPPEPIPAAFVLSGSPHWTIFATFF